MRQNKNNVNSDTSRVGHHYPDDYDHSIIFPEKDHKRPKAKKRPVIYANDGPISEDQGKLLFVLLCKRFGSEVTGNPWKFFEQNIDPKKVGTDLFDEMLHCLQGDIYAEDHDEEYVNEFTKVRRYYSSLHSFMASCRKWKCLKTGGV